MGIRFRKSKKLLPGIRGTLTHKGVGVRVGPKNAGISVSPSGSRATWSIQKTGVSGEHRLSKGTGDKKKPNLIGGLFAVVIVVVILMAIF